MPATKSKSSLVEALEEVVLEVQGGCKVGQWIDSLEEGDRDYLLARVKEIPKGTVYRAVGKMAGVGHTTWNRHFAGNCSCVNGESHA